MNWDAIEQARRSAIQVLKNNASGPFHQLPRTATWGYPEPYTRDLLWSILGIAVINDESLLLQYKKVLNTLADNQSAHGHIPSLVHDKEDRGASDTTPLFLLAVGIMRKLFKQPDYLYSATEKALSWMEHQSPTDRVLVGQLPTTDWRDEQWVLGYGLYVNTVYYAALCMLGQHDRAAALRKEMNRFTITCGYMHKHVHEGLVVKHKPYYALWTYKVYSSERFDLLGNSLAIISGISSQHRATEMINWIEAECKQLQLTGLLAVDLPPNFFPFINPSDPDWHPRYEEFNPPGHYHNGGVWPYIEGLYIAALVAAKRFKLAAKKLDVLVELVKPARNHRMDFGFNEWLKAQDGTPCGQDGQTWSAALFLFAAKCVELQQVPFFKTLLNADKLE